MLELRKLQINDFKVISLSINLPLMEWENYYH